MWLLKERLEDYDIEFSKPPENLDYDISILLFKEVKKGKNINEITEEIINKIKDLVIDYKLINGYLNIKINKKELIKYYNEIFKFEKKNIRVFLEHTSANPNKALHIGHIRNSILGDSLYRLLSLLGYDVITLNYIDDTGAQVADNILGIYLLKIPKDPKEFNLENVIKNIKEFLIKEGLYKEEYEEKIKNIFLERMRALKELYEYEIPEKLDHYFGDFIYVIVNKLYEIVSGLENYKYKIIKLIEEGNNELYYLSKEISDKILLEQLKTLWNFDIYFDLIIRESDILRYSLFDQALNILFEKEIAKRINENGKFYVALDLKKWPDIAKAYSSEEKVLIRSNGTTTYIAKDIAYAMWKLGIIKSNIKFKENILQPNDKYILEIDKNGNIEIEPCDISINVIGSEQTHNQMMVKRVIEEVDKNKKYIHYGYGLVMLHKNTAKIFGIEEDIVKMSGRKGIYINVDDLYNRLYNICFEKFNDKEIAEKLSKGFISLEMLKYDRNSIIKFDINKMLNIEEGNAIYFLYTYARINSLLEKANWEIPKEFEINELNKYEEKLILKLFEFKDILLEIEKNLELNRLYKYLIELVKVFNEFYQNVPILNYKDKCPHRLFLVYLTKEVLEKIFYILKIEPVKRI
ncbi:MAG: arginine--tRNA ligase [Nanopusillaceae archaeon]